MEKVWQWNICQIRKFESYQWQKVWHMWSYPFRHLQALRQLWSQSCVWPGADASDICWRSWSLFRISQLSRALAEANSCMSAGCKKRPWCSSLSSHAWLRWRLATPETASCIKQTKNNSERNVCHVSLTCHWKQSNYKDKARLRTNGPTPVSKDNWAA